MFLGVAHLEALEELSRWSSETLGKQLSCLKGKSADAVRDDLALINDSFHLGDFSDVVDGLLSFALMLTFFTVRAMLSTFLGVVILSLRPFICPSHACFVTNPKNLLATFLYHMKGQSF